MRLRVKSGSTVLRFPLYRSSKSLIRRISLIKEQGSHIFEELCQDLGDIFSIVHELIEEIQGSRQIAAANFLYQARIVSRPAIPRTCRTFQLSRD